MNLGNILCKAKGIEHEKRRPLNLDFHRTGYKADD